jgi:hypothetical protein
MTIPNKMPRVGGLKTIGQVATELAKLYRRTRRGEVDVADASKLASVLAILRQCLEAGDVEQRIRSLEATLAAQPGTRATTAPPRVVPLRSVR